MLAERYVQRPFRIHHLATALMELIGERVFCQRQNRLHDEAALCLSKTNVRMSRMIVLIANAHSKSPQLT